MSTLPTLPTLSTLEPPIPRIRTDSDVELWKLTSAYKVYGVFLRRLNEAVVGYELPVEDTGSDSEAILMTISMLDELDSWIDEIPPRPTPQRFGNLAFRDYGERLEENLTEILRKLLPLSLHDAIPLIQPYIAISFGSFQRIDYGTGHETAFALFLCCLIRLGFFVSKPAEERRIVLRVFERYLRLVWKLQDVYRLEPAGSHGVWGLDDYSFLPYVFGSGQIREREDIPPNIILKPPLPITNLYFISIMRVHQLKNGPFYEHSSQLYSIANGVSKWSKVNSGMFKMYEAEVLGKRVVVQHIPLGGLLPWDPPARQPSAYSVSTSSLMSVSGRTAAPWASSANSSGSVSSIAPLPIPAGLPNSSPMAMAPWATQRSINSSTQPSTTARQTEMPPPTGFIPQH
ncbi:hypothetical protein M422DRAFT_26057 [Sphaerobolus stellatus SS14]|nr:hypothetical protein M422DRAFT_26057 [Sphaerobolus stellatus SS14]